MIEQKAELVIVGGSAGSLQVILELLKELRKDLSFPLILVLHRKAQVPSVLPMLLQRYTHLEVVEIEDKTEIEPGKVYIVPADYHLLFEDKVVASLEVSEKVNFSRPSIDVAFKSAAEIFGDVVVGLLL